MPFIFRYASCLKPLGESYSEPFSKRLCGFSQGYSSFQSMDPLSSQLTRDTSPDWLSLDNLNTKPREIDNPCQSPRVWNQILEFNIRCQDGSTMESKNYFSLLSVDAVLRSTHHDFPALGYSMVII
ncbi:hypothetical protein K1719_029006 [Acacia pycnantha]|nr:hypothetical protein K1719_029006 [Acacia pycnantha]